MSVLSAPAIHYGNAHKKLKRTTVLEDRMEQRAHYILSIAAYPSFQLLISFLLPPPISFCSSALVLALPSALAPSQERWSTPVNAVSASSPPCSLPPSILLSSSLFSLHLLSSLLWITFDNDKTPRTRGVDTGRVGVWRVQVPCR